MRNIRLTIEYDGTNYKGWQRQANGITIQEVIENKLSKITDETIKINGSGRTDSGVHALAQVANFKTENAKMTPDQLAKALNSALPEDIVITGCEEVSPEFHAQYSSKSKTYYYQILNRPYPSALMRTRTWFRRNELDIGSMKEAAGYLKGEHDFRLFAHANITVRSTTRTIYSASLRKEGDLIIFEIEANGFLKRMVRMIVGTLVEIGKGNMSPSQFRELLKGKSEYGRFHIPSAPARGLFLKEVKY